MDYKQYARECDDEEEFFEVISDDECDDDNLEPVSEKDSSCFWSLSQRTIGKIEGKNGRNRWVVALEDANTNIMCCTVCDKQTCYSDLTVHKHCRPHSVGSKHLHCLACEFTSSSFDLIRTHVRKHLKGSDKILPPGMNDDRRSICHFCHNVYPKRLALKLHLKLCEKVPSMQVEVGSIFQCHICEGTMTVASLKTHRCPDNIVIDAPLFQCTVCKDTFTDYNIGVDHYNILAQAISNRHKEVASHALTCPGCDKAFAAKKSYDAHVKRCSSKKFDLAYRCLFCQKDCSGPEIECHVAITCALKNATSYDIGDEWIRCTFCGEDFVSYLKAKAHFRRDHRRAMTSHFCEMCGVNFAKASTLKDHVEAMHRAEKVCPKCGATFRKEEKLKNHIRTVHEGRLFACDLCDYKGPSSDSLRVHKKVKHEKGTLKTCSICGFKSRYPLYMHMKSHMKEDCRYCGKVLLKSSMFLHERSCKRKLKAS